jgi:molybdopterin-binding protein
VTAGAIDLEVRDLRVEKGGRRILEVPSLKVARGEILALLGPNGAGKSTFIHVLALLEKPSAGLVRFKGEDVPRRGDLTTLRRRMAVVLQSPHLFDSTVFANVASGLQFRHAARGDIARRVMESLRFFGIEELEARSARKLSGGEASRVSLARAFVLEPEVLLLDEPFSALDPPTRESLISDLEKMLRKTGITTVFSTHDASEAVRLAGRIAILRGGALQQAGPTDEVINFPADAFIANFVGVETVLPARVVKLGEGTFSADVAGKVIEAVGAAEPGEQVLLCIRPENVTLTSTSPDPKETSARNLFRGQVKKVTPMGYYYKIRLDCGFPLTSCVTRQSVENLSLDEGRQVTASFKAVAVHVIRKR